MLIVTFRLCCRTSLPRVAACVSLTFSYGSSLSSIHSNLCNILHMRSGCIYFCVVLVGPAARSGGCGLVQPGEGVAV